MIRLSTSELAIIKKILSLYAKDLEVRAFGSRVHGRNFKPASDLDLAIYSKDKIPSEVITKLIEAFSESDIRFKIDVCDWMDLPKPLQETISKEYQLI